MALFDKLSHLSEYNAKSKSLDVEFKLVQNTLTLVAINKASTNKELAEGLAQLASQFGAARYIGRAFGMVDYIAMFNKTFPAKDPKQRQFAQLQILTIMGFQIYDHMAMIGIFAPKLFKFLNLPNDGPTNAMNSLKFLLAYLSLDLYAKLKSLPNAKDEKEKNVIQLTILRILLDIFSSFFIVNKSLGVSQTIISSMAAASCLITIKLNLVDTYVSKH